MVPLLFIKSAEGALAAALPMGLLGGLGQAALVDLEHLDDLLAGIDYWTTHDYPARGEA